MEELVIDITVAIATYNRFPCLKKMSKSLYLTDGLKKDIEDKKVSIRVYDDCSTDFNINELKELFPNGYITRRESNLGACQNMLQIFKDFLTTNDDLLVMADSDLLFNPNWLEVVKRYFKYSQGIMSLYNSSVHPSEKEVKFNEFIFLEKRHIGSAGTVLDRKTVSTIVNNVPYTEGYGYDWAWSDFLNNYGIKILTTKQSFVQHIGIYGLHTNGFNGVDFGLGFLPIHMTNQIYLTEFFQESLGHMVILANKIVEELESEKRV